VIGFGATVRDAHISGAIARRRGRGHVQLGHPTLSWIVSGYAVIHEWPRKLQYSRLLSHCCKTKTGMFHAVKVRKWNIPDFCLMMNR
jgi:hypothetical protein